MRKEGVTEVGTVVPGDLVAALRSCGIAPGDTLMLHSSASVAAELRDVPREARLDLVIDALLAALGPEGTLVMPTFTYSFTRGEVFDPEQSPSTVGRLTEHFRRRPGVLRSLDPIFSVAAHGRLAAAFATSTTGDCFGTGSAFDLLYRNGAKLACLACPFDRMTFAHYVEQRIGVDYRSPKRFAGLICRNGDLQPLSVTYLVRDLDRDTSIDLARLKQRLVASGRLRVAMIGRVGLVAAAAHDFFAAAAELLAEDPHSLIHEGAIPL